MQRRNRWRSVELDATTLDVLREHAEHQAVEIGTLGDEYVAEHRLVFCREDGAPLHPDRVSKMFAKHVKASSLPRIRLHDLRHTHATLALTAGIDVKVISERLGHAGSAITRDTYQHVTPTMDADADAKVAALIE